MKPFNRSDRVAGQIRKMLSQILQKQIKDPRLEPVMITSVKVSRDLRLARIYFTVSGEEQNRHEAYEGLKNARGFVKRTLARQLGLKYMPDLKFFYDESFDYGERIDKLLASIKADDESNHTPVETE